MRLRRLAPRAETPKVSLDGQTRTSEHEEIPGVAMYEMLQPVKDLRRNRYIVGILEGLITTLSLFDVALGMPEVGWHKEYRIKGSLRVDTDYLGGGVASLADAWANTEITKYTQLDLALYEHAVDIFNQQAFVYGLE